MLIYASMRKKLTKETYYYSIIFMNNVLALALRFFKVTG